MFAMDFLAGSAFQVHSNEILQQRTSLFLFLVHELSLSTG